MRLPPAATAGVAADDGAEPLEDGLVLLERGRYLIGGDPAIGVKTLGLQFQLFPDGLFHGFLGNPRQHLGVAGAQPNEPLGPKPHECRRRPVGIRQFERRFSSLQRFSGFSGFFGFLGFSGF